MSTLEVQMENLDEQLQKYTPAQQWMISIGSALGIILMGWMFYLSDALDELNTLEEQNSALSRQISENSPEAYKSKIVQTAEMIVKEERKTSSLETDKQALLLQMAASGEMLFDNRQYAKTLDLLLERSVRLGLKIEMMESEESDKNFFGKVREYKILTITGTGNFIAIADFLTFIESQHGLIQIQNIQISSDEEKPRFKAVILYMGVSL